MFKLESYITPLLMGYLDKYVKLRQEDFQLSLWGGDAVLNNLDLRLDELEKVLQLPVMFQSGHIHELRLHVPWTKLGSEPVVITINTVECILKVRDTAYDGVSRSPSKSSLGKSLQANRVRSKKRSQPTEDLPPGYLQSIVNRIINNVTFIINNLILKFVEDDIVLSVNVKSAECFSVDREWNSAFVDLTSDDLALRKVVNFADLTVCLDKTNSSGHIESYQEPMAYRCAVSCRLVMEYDSVSSKLPSATRLNVFCDTLNLSLTDTQLPMFMRFIELCIALYYGLIDIPTSTAGSTTDEGSSQEQSILETETESDARSEQLADQGWASWAWSYVPQILPTEEDEDNGSSTDRQANKVRPSALILSIGIYIHHGTIVFKACFLSMIDNLRPLEKVNGNWLTEKSKDSSELPHKKMHFQPFLQLSLDGVAVEVLLQGLLFCSIQCGLTKLKLTTCGNCICDVADEKVSRCSTLLSGGEDLSNKVGLNYISNSLFDGMLLQDSRHYVVDGDEHRQVYTEQYALQRFGAFWVDNLYTCESTDVRHGASSHSSETDSSEAVFLKEFSTLRFVFGNTHLHCSSTLYHRVSKFIHCATSHQYQPYGNPKPVPSTPEERPKPTEDQVKSLEEFIPTTLLHMVFISPSVTLLQAEHSYCDVAKKNYKYRQKKRDAKSPGEVQQGFPIPAIVVTTSRFDLQITKPMYPGRLVKLVTAIAGPSSNLLHHCHSHLQVKLFGLHAGLQKANGDGTVSGSLTILPPCSFALYLRSLVLPKLWMNSSLPVKEWMYEIPNASININKPSILMCCRIVYSWLASIYPQTSDHILNDSLLDDLFPPSGESTHQNYPLLEIGLSGLEFKSCDSPLVNACVGSLSLLHVFLYSPGIAGKMSVIPILYGPNDTSKICSPDFFKQPALDKTELHCDCVTATFQKPKHSGVSEAQALALVDCQGLCAWLDPGLISWFHYCPQPRPGHKAEQITVTLDLSLAQMTSPLNAVSQASVHSTSSPSHPGISRQQTSNSQPQPGRGSSIAAEEKDRVLEDLEKNTMGQTMAKYFPLLRMFHVQLELKPCAIFLPKTGVPNSESSSDILSIVHQARHAGRLSDTLVICLPSVAVTSTMAKPMNVVQDVPVRSIQGSLIGEKLPWSVKVSSICAYSLMSGRGDPLFLVHPLDIMSTLAVTCKYNPPTSEVISTMALCLHVDVGQPKLDITAAQLHLCATVVEMVHNVVTNALKMTNDCTRQFITKKEKPLLTSSLSHKKSVSSAQKIESLRSVEVTENLTADVSEDFSHEGSPLHENIIDDREDVGVKLTLWLQLMFPRLQCTLYSTCPVTQQESGLAMVLDHFDLSMDSQSVYSKAKLTLGSLSIQHAVKSSSGIWSWSDPDGIVMSFSRQLPSHLHTVTNKAWLNEPSPAFVQHHDVTGRDKKHGALSVTFTQALCKNVKKRLRRANVELPCVNEIDPLDGLGSEGDHQGGVKVEAMDMYYHRYLSEFCIKSEPFDVVLKPEVLQLINALLHGHVKSEKVKTAQSSSVRLDLPARSKVNMSESTSVHNLPLIYADLGKIRFFIHKSAQLPHFSEHTKEVGRQQQTNSLITSLSNCDSSPAKDHHARAVDDGPDSKLYNEPCTALNHDFVVVQINSCLIQPHADNPLPRTAQQKDIYTYAVQSGWTHQPGSVIEDRQYQMDIRGISFSSGVWKELIQEVHQVELRKPSNGSMVQIPALDWNTFLMDSPAHDRKEIQLIPIATPFDFSLVVAPPISYVPQKDDLEVSKKVWLICGLSTELNLTSDLDLYISANQIKLIYDIAIQLSLCAAAVPDSSAVCATPAGATSSPLFVHNNKKEPQVGGFDSGVESDFSTLTVDRGGQRPGGHRQISHQLFVKTDEEKTPTGCASKEDAGVTSGLSLSSPLDILVTASRISCSVYTYKTLEEKFILEMPAFSEGQHANQGRHEGRPARSRKVYNAKDNLEHILSRKPRRSSSCSTDKYEEPESSNCDPSDDGTIFNFMKPSSEDSIKRVIPEGSVCVVPFVYVYMTQPHCLVASHTGKEVKMEVSCYDVLIKGASDRHITAIDELHIIPDCTDFNIHWMETRPGQVHPYTGIPPSLLTVRFTSKPSAPDTIKVFVDRPIRLKLSRLAVEQTAAFTHQVTQMFAADQKNTDTLCGDGDREETQSNIEQKHSKNNALLTVAERLELTTSQVVVVLDVSEAAGAILSSEGIDMEVDLGKERKGDAQSMRGHVQLKDIVLKTVYQKKCRALLGPFSVDLDAGLAWMTLPEDCYLPQIFLALETSMIQASFGQEHLFCLMELVKHFQEMIKPMMIPEKTKTKPSRQGVQPSAKDFVQDGTHDDLRCGKFRFIDGSDGGNNSVLPNVYEIVFSGGGGGGGVGEDTGEDSCMTWCYPHPRVITAMHLIPVPFYLSSSSQSLDSGSSVEASTAPCALQYWDELSETFLELTRFNLSENEPVAVDLPDPKRSNRSMCVCAKTWRVVLLQASQDPGSTKKSDAAVLPASLAACMCVDSAFLPSVIPTLHLTLSIPEAYLQLCHHLDYNGSDIPSKLSLYTMSPHLADQQVFAILKVEKLDGSSTCTTGADGEVKLKLSFLTSLDVLEYGSLKMDTVLNPAAISLAFDMANIVDKKQEINCFLECEKFRLKVGRSIVHTLNMAVASWSSFNPQNSGPHVIFSHYIVCNNTASALRFGQAGTEENIILYSREMYGYSWRSCALPQLMHLCMDKPTWKWTEPFAVDKEGSSVHSVTARDQSYVVIIRVKKLSGLQTQITVCGQLIVCNRLSQPISMRVSLGANSSGQASKSKTSGQTLAQHYVIEPGEHLPALTSNEVMVNPVQFRLAGYSTIWSHEIFLSGDRMKDNQMVKIPLPERAVYFHILCRVFCQHFHGMPQKLIMLTPLYVVRTHLPCPLYIHLNSPKQTQEMKVNSQGREFQLHCTGGDVTHEMAFRLGCDMLLSDPAVKLSTGLIGQLTRVQLGSVDIENMCEQRMDTVHGSWPYLMDEKKNSIDNEATNQAYHLDPLHFAATEVSEESLEPQPSIDLNIRLSEYIPGCDTLLVEVAPVFLVHNDTDLDIVVGGMDGRVWCIKSGHTLAPPLMKEQFKLAIKYQDLVSEEKVIPMSGESQDYRRYNDEIGKVLFVDGYVHASFQITFQDVTHSQMVFLTLTSDIKHDIRVICIRERFALTNQTGLNLRVKLLALPLSPLPICMSDLDAVTVTSPCKAATATGTCQEGENEPLLEVAQTMQVPQPLLRWTTAVTSSVDGSDVSEVEPQESTYVCYVSFAILDKELGSFPKPWKWSLPVRLVSSKDGYKATTSIPDVHRQPDGTSLSGARPDEELTAVTRAICVVTQLVQGVTHIVVSSDQSPACIVENLCPFGLEFGQMCDKLMGNRAIIQEQVELVSDLPWIPPGGWGHYTPPCVNSDLLTRETITIPRLHFRAIDCQMHSPSTIGPSEWSSATQISGNMDAFVRLPGFCDLKVMIHHIGLVTHLIVRPVSKAEITAKEIRSRIKDQSEAEQQAKSQLGKLRKNEGTSIDTELHPAGRDEEVSSPALELSTNALRSSSTFKLSTLHSFTKFSDKDKNHKGSQISLNLGLLCRSLTLVMQDESNVESLSELMCLHLKDFFFACYSDATSLDDSSYRTSYIMSASSLQVDNQQYGTGTYDFPVVLLPQKARGSEGQAALQALDTGQALSIQELHALLKSHSFLQLQVVMFSDLTWHQTVIESVDVVLKPFSLYIDDTYVYCLVQELEHYSPSKLGATPQGTMHCRESHRRLPAVVKLNSYTLGQPIRIKQLSIQPIKMLLSVHASLKLFLASDHTPLSVGKFERANIYSTMHRLSHALTMHYASAAIFRAGIVVGSLEILGNPTGLVRSIGTGVSDLVSLPYSGLTRGPGAFLTGLSRGIGSLFRNVSAGMITSVTNFASSVSRNMDRLSFDTSHLARQEENRRNRPVGVSDGLKQGLTGFGLSLLGAVAGLADQPIQTLISSGSADDRRSSASSAATGFVAGMSKGLVGVFTKPIGGAAEFVSQTGQGILHGTGLGQLPTRLETANVTRRQDLADGPYKYTVKNFSQLPIPELLLIAPALTFDLTGAKTRVTLLLTLDILVVVSCDEDAQQEALSISELDCKADLVESAGRLVLVWVDQMYASSTLENRSSNKDRVAAFIDTQKVSDCLEAAADQLEPTALSDSQSKLYTAAAIQASAVQPSSGGPLDSQHPVGSTAPISTRYEFELEPHWLDLFVTMFRLAKNRLQGRGFPV